MSSHSRAERDLRPLSMRYSSPQRGSYLQPIEASVLSQIYSQPYAASNRVSPKQMEKAPLVKVIQSAVNTITKLSPPDRRSALQDASGNLNRTSSQLRGFRSWMAPTNGVNFMAVTSNRSSIMARKHLATVSITSNSQGCLRIQCITNNTKPPL